MPADTHPDVDHFLRAVSPLLSAAAFRDKFSFSLDDYMGERRSLSGCLTGLANHIEKVSKDTGIAKTTAGSLGIAGGVCGILGLVLAPVTGGGSLALTIAGASLGVASAGTSVTASIVKDAHLTNVSNEVKAKLDSVDAKDKQVMVFLQDLQIKAEKFASVVHKIGAAQVAQYIKTTGYNIIYSSINLGQSAAAASFAMKIATYIGTDIGTMTSNIAKTAAAPGWKLLGVTAGSTAAKSLSSVFAVVGIAFGIWDVVEGAKDIQGCKHAQAYRVAALQVMRETDSIKFSCQGLQRACGLDVRPSGLLQSRMNSMVLDIRGASVAVGAEVVMWHSHVGLNQLWEFTEERYIQSVLTGHVLDVENGKAKAGTRVRMWPKNGSAAQKWTFTPEGYLKSDLDPNLVLDIEGRNKESGSKLVIWKSHNGDNQKWSWAPWVRISSELNDLVLDVHQNNTKQGALVVMWPWLSGFNQQWIFTAQGEIQSRLNGMVLDVENGSAKPCTRVRMWSRNGTDAQKWVYTDEGYLESKLGHNLVLDIEGGCSNQGAKLIVYPKTGGRNQKWRL